MSKKEKSKKEMEPPSALEKTGKSVSKNYDNLLEMYQPTLRKMITAAADIDQCLFELARAQNVYLKAMNELKLTAESANINTAITSNISKTHEMFTKLNMELTDFQKVFSSDLIHPFESKLQSDQTYLESELSSFRDNWNNAMTDLATKEKSLSKLQKNRGKSKKDDQKRIGLESEIIDKKKQLETYAQFNLKKSVLEQNRRYAYVAEKQKNHREKLLLFCEQNIEIVRSQIDDIDIDNLNLEKDAETKAKLMAPRKSIYESPAESIVPPKPTSPPQSITNGEHTKSPSNGKKRVKASHNYGGDGKTKLHMEIGDIVQLLIPQPRDGWHYGENERTSERGWFPIQYTTKVEGNALRRM